MIRQTLIRELASNRALQYLIDRSATNNLFRNPVWKKFFNWKYTPELNWTSYIGSTRNSVAATVTSFDASAPLRTRNVISKAVGEIPTLQEMFQMDKKDLRTYLELSANANADQRTLIDLVFNDIREVSEAPGKRLDMFALEGLSTGQITINKVNNPDGMVLETAIDLGLPDNQKYGTVGDVWATKATATPIADIEKVYNDMLEKGKMVTKIRMRRSVFNTMIETTEVKEKLASWGTMIKTKQLAITFQDVNEFLKASNLPEIELIDVPIMVEKNGVPTAIYPFSQYNVVFMVSDLMGDMFYSYTVEERRPVNGVTYAKFDNALIKRWGNVQPLAEFTAVELPAFPAFHNIENVGLLNTNNKTTYA